jgi:hypothetical protein
MTTATTLITDAMGMLGIVGSADVTSGNDLNLGLRVLNRMLDSWRQQPNMATHAAWVTFTLPGGSQTRTIGPSAQVNVARPTRIEIGAYTVSAGISNSLRALNRDQYADIDTKDGRGAWPEYVYYEAGSPTGTLYFWPVSDGDVTVNLPIRTHIADFADLTTDVTLPAGYESAITPSLAEKLAPYFERAVPLSVARDAASARMALKRTNALMPELSGVEMNSRLGAFLSGA